MMLRISYSLFYLVLLLYYTGCTGQSSPQNEKQSSPANLKRIGGPFEGSELFYVDMPDSITAIDTSPGWLSEGQKLKISGNVLQQDGRTPASDIIIYYYHTDASGLYSNRPGLPTNARRHGYIRGWVKTSANGQYTIYTTRPGEYPNRNEPAHIHL